MHSLTSLQELTTPFAASFACPLVHNLPFCPGLAYAVPLPPPPFPLVAHDASSLPAAITNPLLEYIANFTVTLLTFACGRDFYSPLQSCDDCQTAYRQWLCSVQFPRCTEGSSKTSPQPAFVAQPSGVPQRNTNFPAFPTSFTELLPCLETCQAVDRACPSTLGFRCPVVQFNAAQSYGVGFVDGDLSQGSGVTGMSQDPYGNVWCSQ
jgi:calcium channel MID1